MIETRPGQQSRPKQHHFVTWKRIPWPLCVKCGLVLLRNKRTEKARARPCPDE